jgi:hypothetical protein
MTRLRSLHWVLALMLFASPAIGGQVAPLLHPCEVAEEVSHHGAGGDAGHGGHHSVPGEESDGQCSCIGDCAAPGHPAAPTSVVSVSAWRAPVGTAPRVVATPDLPPSDPPLLRLPPATPPPAA